MLNNYHHYGQFIIYLFHYLSRFIIINYLSMIINKINNFYPNNQFNLCLFYFKLIIYNDFLKKDKINNFFVNNLSSLYLFLFLLIIHNDLLNIHKINNFHYKHLFN